MQNRTLRAPGGTSGAFLRPPGGRPPSFSGAIHHEWEKWAILWIFRVVPRRPWGPRGTPKFAKNRFFPEKWRSKRDFSSIFVHKACFHAFCTIFRRFFTENRWKINEKKDTFFDIAACFFQHGDPHETSYFTIRKQLFRFSRFCVFLKKKSIEKSAPKSRPRFFPQKSLKSRPRGPVLGPKMVPNSRRGG